MESKFDFSEETNSAKAEVNQGDITSLNDNVIASYALFESEIISYIRQKYNV